MLQAHAQEASCAMSAPAPARLHRLRVRRGAMPLALALGTGERAASPVLLTACTLLPRCRQPRLRAVGLDCQRVLDIFATTGRRDVDRHHGHEDPAAGTLAGSAAWPRRREACACEAVPVKPVIRTRSSSRLRPRRRTARPAHHRVQRRRLRPDHCRRERHNKHHHGLVEA